jgi:hypothetical protein
MSEHNFLPPKESLICLTILIDQPLGRIPRINLCDFYLFRGIPGTVAMALTVNPDAGAGGLDTFREEGLYAFRFDLNDDAREEVTFKIRFGEGDACRGRTTPWWFSSD